MATIKALDKDGDWTFGRGKADYLRGINAISQNIETRLGEYTGDWYNDETSGIDYTYYLSNKQTRTALESAIRERILGTEDVKSITFFESKLSDRSLSIVCTVSTIYSTAITINLNV